MNKYAEQTLLSWDAWNSSKHVRINYDELALMGRSDFDAPMRLPSWQDSGVHPADHSAFVSHVFWHNTVNFCFGHPLDPNANTIERGVRTFATRDIRGRMQRGSYAMGACFYRVFREKPILADSILRVHATFRDTKEFFSGNPEIPLLRERHDNLIAAARVLKKKYKGDPRHVFEAAHFTAFGTPRRPGLVEILVDDFPTVFGMDSVGGSFDVNGVQKNLRFHFHKRPQLLALEYHGRAMASNGVLPPITDIEALGPIVDYQIPRFYAERGVLRFERNLERAIQYHIPIEATTEPELEIRGATFYALYWELQMKNEHRRQAGLLPIHMGHLDYLRWSNARNAVRPHHICLTTDY